VRFVVVVSERVGYSHVACMFSVGVFPHFIKISRATFPPHWTNHLQSLEVTVLRPLAAKYAVTRNYWMMASAHSVSFRVTIFRNLKMRTLYQSST
jgi:hypothetical protein